MITIWGMRCSVIWNCAKLTGSSGRGSSVMILYYLFRKEKSPTIGEKVGMLNVASFIRNFKQQTGLAPGQYRSLHTANKAGFEGM